MLMNISSPLSQGGLFGGGGEGEFRTLFLASVSRETGGKRERDLTGFACNEGSWSLLRKLLTEGGWWPSVSPN